MNVRVIIVFRLDDRFLVSVATPRPFGRVWQKEFESKHDCFTELRTLGLLTAPEVAKVRASDFGGRPEILNFRGNAEPEALLAANFVQTV